MTDNAFHFQYETIQFDSWSSVIEYALHLKGKEQERFVEAFCSTGPYARQNVGYISGYYDHETADRIMSVFKTSHPIFGTAHPSAQDAYEMGKKLGQRND